MIILLLGFGILAGLSAAVSVGIATGSWLLAFLGYSAGGTVFVLVAAAFMARRTPLPSAS